MADRPTVLAELRRRKRAGEPLGYDAISAEPWGQALRNRCRALFGTWAAALHAAGIEPAKEQTPWRHADKAAILAEIHRRKRANESLRYGKLYRVKWGAPLVRRAEALFGSWALALLAAGIDPPLGTMSHWPMADKADVLAEIRRRNRAGESLRQTEVVREQWGNAFLWRCITLFGSWAGALVAAGFPAPRPGPAPGAASPRRNLPRRSPSARRSKR